MAVYTEVKWDAAQALLSELGLGELRRLQGISGGIENTNYFASSSRGEWVLTVFERMSREQLPYCLGLMQHLANQGLPVPWPQASGDGSLTHTLSGKPAAVVTRLPGRSIDEPTVSDCAQLGQTLGRMHRLSAGFPLEHPHERGLNWWSATLPQVLPHVPESVARSLRTELAHQLAFASSSACAALPRGPVHADLFRDNALFTEAADGHRLSGVFDFYFAGTDALLFDVAVCLNDWCLAGEGPGLDAARADALLTAYAQERPWAPGEREQLPTLLRAAALRFWISRLWDWYLPREASLLTPKDPAHFERMLAHRIDNPELPTR